MSKEKTKEEIISHKKLAIRKINGLMEHYLASNNKTLLKKVDLISYWLESFSTYIGFEDEFDSSRLIRYTRGSVIRLNFGFNIGKEFGGLHYAVVIDNDNKRNADVLTVVPLSSSDGRTIHPRNVDLGTELYEKIKAVQRNLVANARKDLDELKNGYDTFNATFEALGHILKSSDNINDTTQEMVKKAELYKKELENKIKALEKNVENLERNDHEISKLKSGSMAVANQITTVSKQRIYTPKRSEDFLYGISLSPLAMDKINVKLQELFIHS